VTTNFAANVGEIGLPHLYSSHWRSKTDYDVHITPNKYNQRFNGSDDSYTLYINLVNFGSVTPEITTLECVIFATSRRKRLHRLYWYVNTFARCTSCPYHNLHRIYRDGRYIKTNDNSHASKIAKIMKRGYYPQLRRLHVNMMLSDITFYDFCSFWCVAVDTVDKLQFLSFMCAVLLSITVHFIALRVGGLVCITILKFCWNRCKCFWDTNFPDGDSPPCWISEGQNFI